VLIARIRDSSKTAVVVLDLKISNLDPGELVLTPTLPLATTYAAVPNETVFEVVVKEAADMTVLTVLLPTLI
jgi:hypothetical protein